MAERPKAEKTKKAPAKKTPVYELILPDKTVIDLSTFDVGPVKLTVKELGFVFCYTWPGTDAYQNQSKSASYAGYKTKKNRIGTEVRHNPDVDSAIQYVMAKHLGKSADEEFYRILEERRRVAHYDIADYLQVKEKTIPVKNGDPVTIEVEEFKDIEELTPEQRVAVLGIDYRGQQAVKTLVFADKEKQWDWWDKEYRRHHPEASGDEFDTVLTIDVIKDNLAIKVSARKGKDKIAQKAGFLRNSDEVSEEL